VHSNCSASNTAKTPNEITGKLLDIGTLTSSECSQLLLVVLALQQGRLGAVGLPLQGLPLKDLLNE